MQLTYIDHESRRIIPVHGSLEWHHDKAGRFWLWSEDLQQNLAIKQENETEALKEALNSALHLLELAQQERDALLEFKAKFNAFLDSAGYQDKEETDY